MVYESIFICWNGTDKPSPAFTPIDNKCHVKNGFSRTLFTQSDGVLAILRSWRYSPRERDKNKEGENKTERERIVEQKTKINSMSTFSAYLCSRGQSDEVRNSHAAQGRPHSQHSEHHPFPADRSL